MAWVLIDRQRLLAWKDGGYIQFGIGCQHAPEKLFHFGIMLPLHLFKIIKAFQRCLVPHVLEPLAVQREVILASIHVGDRC